jgi:hypothetical protein
VRREDFEHVIRAAAKIVEDELVVIGSQAIHAEIPSPPEGLLMSRELDVYPRSAPERAIEIDGAIGDGSMFDRTFGYYAHAVGPETPTAPAGWEERLVRVDLPATKAWPAAVAWCMSLHDLVLAKLAAGRPHDLEFVREAIRSGLVDREQLAPGLELMPDQVRDATASSLDGILAQVNREP